MVVCPADHGLQADIIFVIEGTAVNGAYINDLKTNYIIPSLEYFSQGSIDESNFLSEGINSYYGIVVYQAADCLPHPSSDTIGPFVSPSKVLSAIDKLELIGGKGESHANIAEGLATTLQCFDELQQKRDNNGNIQRHCILVCNSPPYSLGVFETHAYTGKTAEQLAAILQEKNINLSIISPRKIPSLYKLFEKAGGDLSASQTKNYAKDPRHLVLLRGFSLKERPLSPPAGTTTTGQTQIPNTTIPITSLPSPLASNDSPISSSSSANTGVPSGVGPSPVYRPPSGQGMVNARGAMMGNNPMNIPQLPAPPGYHQANRPRWPAMLPPTQPRSYLPPNQQVNTTQSSALIAQLTQPPNSMPGTGVPQYGQMGNNSPLNSQQQQSQMKINIMNTQNPQPNVQTSMSQNSNSGIQTMSQVSQSNQAGTSPGQSTAQPSQPLGPGRERPSIWQGLLEWIEKPKNPTDQQKITKHVPCQVSANSKDGEPELKADGWPSKLIMQLMPKQLIGNIGGAYLKNSKSVLFHPQPCEALESLTKVMSSGFAGCVHFTSTATPATCDIKVLILLYTAEKRAYLGFIPNDQGAFVDRLRKVIQQQKSTQIMRQTQGGTGQPMNPQTSGALTMGGTPPQLGGSNPVTSQTMSQTNNMTLGGGQITQNIVTSSAQAGILGQNVPGGPRLRMQQNMQPGMGPQSSQSAPNQNMAPGMMGTPPQRAPFENQLQVERQQNLEKINQLKQTLEAAQQQEQQYKSQLERISHMKTSQLQEALQICQQNEMKYKILDQQQRMANQNNPQAGTAQQQQRMMRPVMGANPGLRHLLQQQPQYRQQLMNMQQMAGNGPRPQMNQQMQNSGNNQQSGFDEVSYDFM
ncbi:mediator of RNA polymerase II transcription subunit 25-like isoform X3 [Tribolium madens]|uniref:mediator of RNA polymerase II transcription subunit 25-like isoform X3 n=1 Tax=Tribolium madens TaxID=41895 RepID=UPI001CF75369|nr:mediator of RNA polymerase II transcription subunit 25-like isoform X3 [Tribolium madens]